MTWQGNTRKSIPNLYVIADFIMMGHWTIELDALNKKKSLQHIGYNSLRPSGAYMHQQDVPSLVQIMTCPLIDTNPLSEPMLPYWSLHSKEHISVKLYLRFKSFHWWKCIWKCCLWNKWWLCRLGINVLNSCWHTYDGQQAVAADAQVFRIHTISQ